MKLDAIIEKLDNLIELAKERKEKQVKNMEETSHDQLAYQYSNGRHSAYTHMEQELRRLKTELLRKAP